MRRSPLRQLRVITAKLGFERDWNLIIVAAGIGIVMGVAALAFITPLQMIEHWSEDADRGLLIWLVPLSPVIGAFLTGVVLHIGRREKMGPGVSTVMYAIHRLKSQIHFKTGIRKWIASTFTIGSGGSAGAEGPIVTIGAAIGSSIARLLGSNPQNTATLLGCGAAAGIASVFNAPFAGIFFVMEILLRDFSLKTFTPIVISAVMSSVVTSATLAYVGLPAGDAIFALREGFDVGAFSAVEIPNYIVLGFVCALTAVALIRLLRFTETVFGGLRVHPIVRPVIGAAMLGVLGLGFIVISDSHVPAFYANGYPVTQQLLDPSYYFDDADQLRPIGSLFTFLVALAILKIIATCLTIGSGGSGGLFAPSLLIGAAVGGAFGYMVNSLAWFPSASPAHYALVGMAAVIAATVHAPLTAILLVYEITRSYEIMLPLMLAAVISTLVARFMFRESIYTYKLTAMGVRVGAMSDLTILRRMTVRDVPLASPVFVREHDTAQHLLDLAERHAATDFIVVDEHDSYIGLVTSEDLRAALVYREAIPLLQVSELTRSDLPAVSRDETLDVVLDHFTRHDAQALAVVDEHAQSGVIGLVTRSRLLSKYHLVLSRS